MLLFCDTTTRVKDDGRAKRPNFALFDPCKIYRRHTQSPLHPEVSEFYEISLDPIL